MKTFSLAVTNACHENWDAMTPEQKGRFCGQCNKTVIDFSNMTDRQLASFFTRPVGQLCGRFHTDQLNRTFSLPAKSATWLKPFFPLTLPAMLLVLRSDAQTEKDGTEIKLEFVRLEAKSFLKNEVQASIMPVTPLGKKATHVSKAAAKKPLRKNGKLAVLPMAADTSIKNKIASDTVGRPLPAENKEPFIMGVVSFQSYKAEKEKQRKEEMRNAKKS